MSKLKLASLIIIGIVAGFVISACTSSNATESIKQNRENSTKKVQPIDKRGTKLGDLAPDFELTKVSGEKVSFESLKGKPAVLVFWLYYCPVCEEEAPHINKLNAEFKSKGVQVLGINVGESEARTQSGIKEFGIQYDVARDEGTKVSQKYNVLGTPTVVFLDKDGIVRYYGNELPKDYAERLNKLI